MSPGRRTLHACRLAAAAALCALAPAAGHADAPPPELRDLSLEQLMEVEIPTVVAASRHEEPVTDAPAAVTIVTAEDIRRFGYRTLGEILASVTGFFVSDDYSYAYAGARGLLSQGDLNTRFLLLLDGHRLNDNVYGQALVGTEAPFDVELIDRVEVIRGPASSLYGSSAFYGTISVVTRRGAAHDGHEVSLAGTGREAQGRLAYSHVFASGLDVAFSASKMHDRGERLYFGAFDDPQTNHGVAAHADDDDALRVFARAAWRGFSAEALWSRREKGIPTGAFGMIFNDPRARTVDRRALVALGYQRALGEAWDLDARLAWDRTRYDGSYPVDNPPPLVNRDVTVGESWGVDVRLKGTPWQLFTLTLGVEYRDDVRQDQRNYDAGTPVTYFSSEGHGHFVAAYAQAEARLGAHVRLDAGLRHDHYDTFGGTTNPRLALVVAPRHGLAFKALYGSAFRAPTPFEIYSAPVGSTTGGAIANPTLGPEKIATGEVVAEWFASPALRLSASAFRYEVTGLIRQYYNAAADSWRYRNAGRTLATGIEAEFGYTSRAGLSGTLGVAYADARDDEASVRLGNSPHLLVKSRLFAPLAGPKAGLGIEVNHTASSLTLRGRESGAFTLVNLVLSGRGVWRGLDYSLGVYNAFDCEYGLPGSDSHAQDVLAQRGRTVRGKIAWRF